MSKIGRMPIELSGVKVEIKGNTLILKSAKGSIEHVLPSSLKAEVIDNKAIRLICDERTAENRMVWGLHRALLANTIKGLNVGFTTVVNINGLGFKAAVSGDKITFSLGFSHKIVYQIPKGITVEVDKTGQVLTVKGADKEKVGKVCSEIRALRPPEPYKGTGIKLATENIIRKAGKTKAA